MGSSTQELEKKESSQYSKKMFEDTDDAKAIVDLKEEDAGIDSGHATESDDEQEDKRILAEEPYTRQIVWANIVKFIILHSFALYGLTFLPGLSWQSWIFLFASYQFSGAGITAGAHRLWSHKTYKAKYPLRLSRLELQELGSQNLPSSLRRKQSLRSFEYY